MKKSSTTWLIGIIALAFAGTWAVLSVVQPGPEDPTVEAVPQEQAPPEHALRVRIVNTAGQVPPDCAGTLTLRVDGGRRLDRDSTLRCGADGGLFWADLEPGTWRIAVAGEGTEVRELDIEVDGAMDLGVWTLVPGGNVSGVVHKDGEPFLGAQIRTKSGQRSVSITDGQYVLRGVPEGVVEVFAGHDDHGASGQIEVVAGEVVELDLRLEQVAARGVIGVLFDSTDSGLQITRVHPGGPARALAVGALVTTVDGYDTRELSQAEAKQILAGVPGSEVELVVDGEPISLIRVDLASLP